MFNWSDVAMQAYEAYGDSVGWVNHQGNPMPQWQELPDTIKAAWEAAAFRAANYVKQKGA